MTTDRCEEMRLKLQADLDGELEAGDAASVAAHTLTCPDCAAVQAELSGLSARLRTEISYHAAPVRLRQAIEAAIAPPATPSPVLPVVVRSSRFRGRLGFGMSFGAGFALAACLALVMVLPRGGGDLADSVVASHIRALQPGHLMDVVSTDQHTVKPWFDGRLDFAPPVKDFAAEGFPLIGGRLDYLGGRTVAALSYRRDKHIIDLYVWPGTATLAAAFGDGAHNGYNVEHWTQDGMVFWAVSDVEAAQLADFAKLWQAAK
jgi:anti-sigma factor RsiW